MSSVPVALRANYSDLFGSDMLPVLEEIFKSEISLHQQIREQLFQVKKTERDIYQSTSIHDMPMFEAMSEGEDYSYFKPNQGASKTMSIVKYGLGFSISEEAVEDGKFDFIADAVRKMAQSAQESQEISAMDVINNGFGSQNTADGADIFSTSHLLPSGLTFRNRPSTDVDLSPSSLDAALQDYDLQFIGDHGAKKRIKPSILLVHPSNKRYAMEIIGSDLKADTMDNNMNSLKQDGLRVISSPHITDSDSWFLFASPSENGLRLVKRKELSTKSKEVFENDSILYKASYREVLGAIEPYGLWGTTGI
jgi:hypothetical protein